MRLLSLPRSLGSLIVVAALVVSLGGASLAAPPSQGALDDAREREQNLGQQVQSARAELAQVEAELEQLQVRMEAMQERLEAALEVHREAESAAMDAAAIARATEKELDAALAELSANTEMLGDMARDAYKYGAPSASPTMTTFELLGDSSEELGDRLHFLTRGLGVRSGAIEQSEVLRIKVEVLTELALEEERKMEALEAAAAEKRDEAAELHAQVADLVSEQSVKLDRSAELVVQIESDRQAAEVRVGELEVQVQREIEEAERRERERREREERERQERERQERERQERERQERERQQQERQERERQQRAAASSGNSSSSGSSAGGSSSGGSSSSGSSGRVSNSAAGGNLRTVGGITVAASLASNLERLLNDARADGIVFGGNGYRSPEVTARLRIANGCPDVYNSPASSCRVPTARPGSSEHEKGLAVDFTYRGQTICYPRPASQCSGNAGYDWLRQNAHRYGLKNLPSEAWHWSTSGR